MGRAPEKGNDPFPMRAFGSSLRPAPYEPKSEVTQPPKPQKKEQRPAAGRSGHDDRYVENRRAPLAVSPF